MGKYTDNNIYIPSVGEVGWGTGANANFIALSELMKKVAAVNQGILDLSSDFTKLSNRSDSQDTYLDNKINSVKTNLTNTIENLNNSLNELKNTVANIDTTHASLADRANLANTANVAKSTTGSLNINGNTIFNGSKDVVVYLATREDHNSLASEVRTNNTQLSNRITTLEQQGFKIKVVNALPTVGEANTFYFVPKNLGSTTNNVYDEYVYTNNKWELIGDTEAKLTNFYDKIDSDNRYVSLTADQVIRGNKQFANAILGNLQGNARTASSLLNEVTINGTKFNGSQSVTTVKWGTAREFRLTDGTNVTTNIVDGGSNVTIQFPKNLSLSNIKATNFTGSLNGDVTGNLTGNVKGNVTGNLYGNASTASKFNHTVSLWGNAFDGSYSLGSQITFQNNSLTNLVVGTYGIVGVNDWWRVGGGASGQDAGYLEIATGDNGTEPIYIRQYDTQGTDNGRTLTLLDGNHNSIFPGNITANVFNGNLNGNANTSTKATQNINGHALSDSIINAISCNNATVTYRSINGVSGSFTVNNVAYATNAGRAYPKRSDGTDINIIWNGQSGQPNCLVGGNNGVDFYVYNPSNFRVSYANSSGSCTGNASTATKANQNSSGHNLVNTIVKGISINGRTITVTKLDGSSYTLTTQDNNTTYLAGTNMVLSGTTFSTSLTPSFTNIQIGGQTISVG